MKNQYDFTEGNILKQLIFFSGPIILANLLQTSYQLVDSLWIGNLLGANALRSGCRFRSDHFYDAIFCYWIK